MPAAPQPGPPPEALQDFPVRQGVAESFRRTFANLPHFPAAAVLPTVLTVILNVFSIRLVVETVSAPESSNPFAFLVLLLLNYCPYILFSVAWFRLVLLGEERARPSFLSGWTLRHWRFLRYVFAIIGIAMLASMIATMLASLLVGLLFGAAMPASEGGITGGLFLTAFLVTSAVMVMMLRFSFVFPAAAVDETYGLAMSWRHTKGQALRIFAAALLIALPFAVVASVIGGLFSPPLQVTGVEGEAAAAAPELSFGLGFFLLEGVMGLLGYLMTAVLIQMIALAFQLCTGWVPDDGAGPPALRHDDAHS